MRVSLEERMRPVALLLAITFAGTSYAASPDHDTTAALGPAARTEHAGARREHHPRPSHGSATRPASHGSSLPPPPPPPPGSHVRPGDAYPPPPPSYGYPPPPPSHARPYPAPRPHYAAHPVAPRPRPMSAYPPPRPAPPPPPPEEYYAHRYHNLRPYDGVIAYGPRPRYHYVYRDRVDYRVKETHVPDRAVERENSLAIGISGGSIVGGYDHASPFADPGLGGTLRYRPDESVGLQANVASYGMQSDDSFRTNTSVQASAVLFAYPWTRVSPYVLGGVTWDARNYNDAYRDFSTDVVGRLDQTDVQWGPHVGVGLEIAIGKVVAIDVDAKYTGFVTADAADPTIPGALQTGVGLLLTF